MTSRMQVDTGGDPGNVPATTIATTTTTAATAAAASPALGSEEMAGKILEIHAQNFLCHANLKISLHSRVNVICGENGSGKSAILAALQVCLGSKTSSTSRGSAAKNLIQHDKEFAFVSIVLSNEGPDAFRPDLYGSAIRIQRQIDKNGSGGYKIMNVETGKVISDKKQEVDMIRDRFNIQVDNCSCVLTQEVAKRFLTTASPQVKYQYFLEGTQLGAMREEFVKVSMDRDELARIVARRQDELVVVKKRSDDATARFESCRSLQDLEQKYNNATAELAWSMAAEAERRLQGLQQKLSARVAVMDGLAQNMEAAKAAVEAKRLEIQQSDLGAARSEDARRIENDLQQTTRSLQGLRRNIAGCVSRRKTLEQEIRDAESRKSNLILSKQHIQEQESTVDRELVDNRSKQSLLEAQLQDLASRASGLDAESGLLFDHKQSLTAEKVSLTEQLSNVNREITNMEGERQRAQGSLQDRLRAFDGGNMPQLVRLIASNISKFSAPPIGPLAFFLEPEPRFAGAVQRVLNKMCRCFIVHNLKDERTLRSLLAQSQHGRRDTSLEIYSIEYTTQGYRSPVLPAPFHRTLESIMHFRPEAFRETPIPYKEFEATVGPTIMNLLKDFRHIERTLVFDHYQEAYDVMRRSSQMPTHVSEVILDAVSVDGSRVSHRDGKLSVQTADKTYFAPLFGAGQNVQDRIRDIDARLERLRNHEKRLLQSQLNSVEAKLAQEIEAQFRSHERQQKQLMDERMAIEKQLNSLKRRAKDLQRPSTLSEIDDHIRNEEETIASARREIEVSIRQEEELQQELRPFTEREGQLKERAAEVAEQQTEIRRVLQTLDEEVTLLRQNHTAIQRQLEIARTEVKAAQSEVSHESAHASGLTEQAQEIMSRSDLFERLERTTLKAPEECRKAMTRLRTQIDAQKQRLQVSSVEDLEHEMKTVLSEYRVASETLRKHAWQLDEISKKLEERKQKWAALRDHLKQAINLDFNRYLQMRKYTGRVDFDDEKETLDIVVHLSDASRKVSATVAAVAVGGKEDRGDTAGLSGGEKSFAQLCFLVTLWNYCEMPFHAIDEFDVFMDAVHRRFGIELIMNRAEFDLRYRQFIMITPLDTSVIPRKDFIKIHTLRPPRQQAITSFMQPQSQLHPTMA